MPEYAFSLTRIYPYKNRILENTGYKKRQGYDQKRKLFRTNSFVLAHSSAAKISNDQLTVKSSIQWYHMIKFDVI